jgi:hypothetical protein
MASTITHFRKVEKYSTNVDLIIIIMGTQDLVALVLFPLHNLILGQSLQLYYVSQTKYQEPRH